MFSLSKSIAFSNEHMHEKLISELPSMGNYSITDLKKLQIFKCYHVFAIYLMLNKDQNKFQEFLQHYLPYNTWLETCYQAISSWDDKFFKGRTCDVLHAGLGPLGFNEPEKVLAKYLLFHKDQDEFKKWMALEFISFQTSEQCCEFLSKWCNEFL